jgi:16S rRNA (adenine1518-N6/adenine1519-N6)-dimethyltransferase
LELKKSLGQHFLIRPEILESIFDTIYQFPKTDTMVEIGPGMGALTEYIEKLHPENFYIIEMDDRFVVELPKKFDFISKNNIFHTDVLKFNWNQIDSKNIHIVGNFPYNISTQIVFMILENFEKIEFMTGMFQKEVAKRIASKHKTKDYGILSVLTQSIYNVKYHFDIPADAFDPPPKVVSGIITMERLEKPLADYNLLKRLVKTAFNQRRKTLNNSLKSLQFKDLTFFEQIKGLRPEQLSVEDFFRLSEDLI